MGVRGRGRVLGRVDLRGCERKHCRQGASLYVCRDDETVHWELEARLWETVRSPRGQNEKQALWFLVRVDVAWM